MGQKYTFFHKNSTQKITLKIKNSIQTNLLAHKSLFLPENMNNEYKP